MVSRIYMNLPQELVECVKCHWALPRSEFAKNLIKKNGLKSWCRKCAHTFLSEATKEKERLRSKLRGPNNYKLYGRFLRLKKYGLTEADYQLLLEKQGYVCAVCGNKPLLRRLAVDHCHKTGNVRGLLCRKCNQGIGHFNDDPKKLKKAIEYLSCQ